MRAHIFFIFVSVISIPINANDYTDVADLFELSLEELMQVRVTTATRHNESLRSVPASITVFTRKQLDLLGINDLATLVNFVPGYQSQRTDLSSSGLELSSRGQRTSYSGSEILVLLDGQRLNSDWSGGATLSRPHITLEYVTRVEFIRGPGSSIYGSNAYLGIINLISGVGNEVSVAAGNNKSRTASLQWHKQWDSSDLSIFFSEGHDNGDSLEIFRPLTQSKLSTSDPREYKEILLKLNIDRFSLSANHNTSKSEKFYIGGFTSNGSNQTVTSSSFINLNYIAHISDNISVNSTVFASERSFELNIVSMPGPSPVFFDSEFEIQELGTELTLSYNNHSGTDVLLGMEYRQPDITRADAVTHGAIESSSPLGSTGKRTISGVFGQFQKRLSDDWQFVAGARLDSYSNIGSHLSPRSALVWEYSQEHNFKLLYGESFRSPSRIDTDIKNNPAIEANPDLDPEVARTSEFIWQYFNAYGLISNTLFYTLINDSIIDTATTPSKRINAGEKSISGLEIEWQHQWNSNWNNRINATWIFDESITNTSEANVLLGGSLVYQQQKWSAAMMVNYHNEKKDIDTSQQGFSKIPGRILVDSHFRWNAIDAVELYLHVNNLLDKRYFGVADRVNIIGGVPARGRELMAGLSWSW